VCTRYGLKLNPRIDLGRLYGRNRWQRKREVALLKHRKNPPSLIEDAPKTEVEFGNNLKEPISIILGGSAGEGVQRAASFLAQAVMKSGLHVATKGSYPATVGVGFSNAEILISSQQIGYYGINKPDVAIITSKDGLMHNKERIRRMKRGTLFIDSSLKPPETNAKIVSHNFHKIGARNAALYSIFFFVHKSKIIPIEALIKVVKESALGDKIPIEEFLEP
jgi:Pyruvate/2-oxoacid:ferredoxin oxidoreductase gamma subunit